VTIESQLFAPAVDVDRQTMANTPMGERAPNQRYKLPCLSGETPPKSVKGADWVPGGVQSMTNLASSISDTKALGDYLREQSQIGLALRPDLMEELAIVVNRAKLDGVDFTRMRDYPLLRAQLNAIHEQAKTASGANAARQAGINRHTVWETRAATGQLVGTRAINAEIEMLEQLLASAGLERVPGLSERVVRNVELNAAGRFDDILRELRTGRLLMSDLKTKAKPFWTWLEIDGQLSGYATAEWMLHEGEYVPGPKHYVDQAEGVVLSMPSDGGQPMLRRADLVEGMKTMRLAREVCTQRSNGKSAGRFGESYWPTSLTSG
jgi:hypothetical protein